MVVALVVTLIAAGLVLFYQYRALTALDSQTRVVFRQISEQTATDVVLEIRRPLDGPVFDTLLAVTHPELRAGREVDGDRQVFLRLYWSDASRIAYYAVLGFVVSPSRLPTMFNVLYERSLADLLRRRGGDLRLALRVTDERGRVVYGTAEPHPRAATVTVPMSFYPLARIESRLVADSIRTEVWRVEVSPPDPGTRLTQGYWPTVASVVLMLVAFGLTVLANRRAADLARMQADFIAHVSHQLKTPLSLIRAATETVEMEHVRKPEKLMQYLGIIRGEATRLSDLVQRILEFSRLQQPPTLEFEVLDLGPLVRETVQAFERSLAGRRFTFHFELSGPSPWVTADSAALEQVVANLLDNAVKYSADARDVRVRVGSADGEALIEVIDYGPGIPIPERVRIFEKFFRGSAASLHVNGFGLGLAIVRELVRAHHGRVEVESTPGRGSTFRVVLPAEPVEGFESPARAKAARPSEAVS
jgi:signal transduction histidine kinase